MEAGKVSKDDQIIGGVIIGLILSMILMVLFCTISYENGMWRGRVDIASGRVTATQVPNSDGLTSWKFEEVKK